MSDLSHLEQWAGQLLAHLGSNERRKLATTIAQELRRSNQARIKAQQNPDGTAFAERKNKNFKRKTGRIQQKKAAMFNKIRLASHIKEKGNSDGLEVGFVGRTARIARVHQFGLRDKVDPKSGKQTQYQQRQLLGVTETDKAAIMQAVLNHLS
jgi:phage virion morphogenesis protein